MGAVDLPETFQNEVRNVHPLIDALLQRYEFIERDIRLWRERIEMDGYIFEMKWGAFQAHPLIDRVLKGEQMLHRQLTEMARQVRILREEQEKPQDEFDLFLRELERANHPHGHRHTGDTD